MRTPLPGTVAEVKIPSMTLTRCFLIVLVGMLSNVPLHCQPALTLAERLGYKAGDRLLIVNGDDVGMCHAANVATVEALEKGVMTSATSMVPCPWFNEIAGYATMHPGKDFGIHLCQTSEWKFYRWGPVAPRETVPGLVDPNGYFWSSVVLDLDLEAPGLSYLDPELPDESPAQAQRQLPLQKGFVDLVSDAKERGEQAHLFTLSAVELEQCYTRKIKIPSGLRNFTDGSLRIMPAGSFDRHYSQRLDALNLSALYREGLGEPLIRAFKRKLGESGLYDYVLVDSRTGISEGAGICTRDLADHLMILSGLNRQNVEGTCEFLREFRAATEGNKKLQIILSPMSKCTSMATLATLLACKGM